MLQHVDRLTHLVVRLHGDERRHLAVAGRQDLLDADDLRPLDQPVLEEPRVRVDLGQVVAARVRQDHDDHGILVEAPRDLERGDDRRAGGAADQDPLLAGDPAGHAERVAVRDPHVPVDERGVEGRRPEVLTDALGQVGVHVARVQRALGIGADDEQLRTALLQEARRAGDRATGPDADDEGVDRPVGLAPDLRPGGLVVGGRVLRIEVLVGLEGARDLLGEAVGDAIVGLGGLGGDGGGGDHDLGAVRPQERDLLLAHLVRHHEDALVTADRRGDREPVAGVARRRLDDRPTRAQEPLAFGGLDHPQADPVLHAPAGVQHLELGQDRRPDASRDLVEPDQRRVAHRVQERVEYLHARPLWRRDPIVPRTGVRAVLGRLEAGGILPIPYLVETGAEPMSTEEPAAPLPDAGGSILVVDDDPFIARLLEIELRAAGFDVRVASDGERALELARERCPELVLADVMMPNMDGFELTKQLRQDSRTASASVIMLTARGLSADKLEGFSVGADDYIVKPFDTPELLARIRGVLRRAKERRQQSPLTGLPGNLRIEDEIEGRVRSPDGFALLYADLDNFKAYNDHYGFMRGDEVIQVSARLIESVAGEAAGPGAFVGHVGGDDFVIVCDPGHAERVAELLVERFDRTIPDLYDPRIATAATSC